jgi:predicted phage tail protein
MPDITRVFRALRFPSRRREVVSGADATPINVQPGEMLYDEAANKLYAGREDTTAVQVGVATADSRWNLFLPTAPTGLAVTAGNSQATLSWTAPTGVIAQAPITDYREQYSSDNGTTWTPFTAAVSTATSATITGLTNGTAYRFRVAALNGVGTGDYTAASSAVTPTAGTPPNAPTSLTATAGSAQIALSWTAPSAPGTNPITSYTVEYTPAGGAVQTVSTGSTSTSYTLTGLNNGTAYTVRVAAVSASGIGTYSGTVTRTPVAVTFVAIPEMTSNTAPSGSVLTFGNIQNGTLTNGSAAAWFWFSRQNNAESSLSASDQPVLPVNSGIGYQFASGQSLISGFEIAQSNRVRNHYAAAFVFAGSNDGSNWTTISTHSGLDGWDDEYGTGFWQPAVVKIFSVSPSVAYSMYRWTITSAPGTYVEWSKVQLRQ